MAAPHASSSSALVARRPRDARSTRLVRGMDGAGTALAPDAPPLLRVYTLGRLVLRRGDDEIPTGGWRSEKPGLLFTALLSGRGRRLSREQAIMLLWPERELASTSGSLREVLAKLRRQCGGAAGPQTYVRGEDALLILAPNAVWSDADHFEREAAAALAANDPAACAAAIALYRGEYLPRCASDELPAHAALIMRRRAVLRHTYGRLLAHAATLCADADSRAAQGYLRRAFVLDRTNEEVARRLMTQMAAAGAVGKASVVYNALARALAREHGVEPCPQTRTVRDRLLATSSAPTRASMTGVPTMLAVAGTGMPPASIAAIVAAHRGAQFAPGRWEGAWCFAFDRPVEAFAAAWLLAMPGRDAATPRGLRLAVHTGACEAPALTGRGAAVSACALATRAHPGQVLVSHTAEALARGALPAGRVLAPLDRYTLFPDAPAEMIYQLSSVATPIAFPPLAAPRYRPHNLPAPVTSYIERPDLEARLAAMLTPGARPGGRLLTLTGVGGVGKTRLALRLAETLLPRFPDGVWLVELAALRDARDLPAQVGRALGLREERGRPYTETIEAHLRARERPLLIVLDNCEHLLADCARLVAALLRAGSQVSVLATSRARLGMLGERHVAAPVLTVPRAAAEIAGSEAERLFWSRAEEANPARTRTGAPWPRSRRRSTTCPHCWPAVMPARTLASRLYARCWTGATICSVQRRASSSGASPSLPAAGRWMRRTRSAAEVGSNRQRSRRCSGRYSPPRWRTPTPGGRGAAIACWSRCASTRWSDWSVARAPRRSDEREWGSRRSA